MEIWQLKSFKAVASTMHFTRASEELKISQPAVSHQIKALEIELGEPLFRRYKKRVELTPQGKIALVRANEVLNIVEAMKTEIRALSLDCTEVLKLSSNTRALANPFLELRKGFRDFNPGAEIYYVPAKGSDDVINKVRRGQCDVGVTVTRENTEGLGVIPYGEFKMIPVVGRNHRLAGVSKRIGLQDLENEEWLLFDKETRLRKVIDKLFEKHQFVAKNAYQSSDGLVLREMIEHGTGVGFMPSWGIVSEIEDGRLIPLDVGVSPTLPVYIIFPADGDSTLTDKFVTYLINKPFAGIDSRKAAKGASN